jgi:hypothetical protein
MRCSGDGALAMANVCHDRVGPIAELDDDGALAAARPWR